MCFVGVKDFQDNFRWLVGERHVVRVALWLIIGGVFFLSGCAATGPGEDADGQKPASKPPPKTLPKVDPKATAAYEAALDSLKNGDTVTAERQLRRLTQQFPTFSGPHANLGIIYFQAEKPEQAKASFNKALELNPENLVSLNHLGILSRREGKFKEAYSLYEKALQIDPDYPYAHLNFGILLELYMGKLPEALEHYKRYQELTKEEDQEVKKWIVDLGRRVKNKAKE